LSPASTAAKTIAENLNSRRGNDQSLRMVDSVDGRAPTPVPFSTWMPPFRFPVVYPCRDRSNQRGEKVEQ